jgi:6-phosphogluconolactonase
MMGNQEITISLVNGVRWYQVCTIMACTWVLSSCSGPAYVPISGLGCWQQCESPYAYVATATTLTTYSITPSTGGLAVLAGSPLTFPDPVPFVAAGIVQIAPDPSGRFLYVLDQSAGIYAYAINGNTGGLTVVAGSPFGGFGSSFAFDASGTYLFVAGLTGNPAVAGSNTNIQAYSVDSSGALVPLANYTISGAFGEPNIIIIVGNHLYLAASVLNSILAFSIGPSGELSQVPGSPFATDQGPFSIAADPSGSVLYTANVGEMFSAHVPPGTISAFTIDSSTGVLTPVPGNPQPIEAQGRISISPRGEFLFVPVPNGVSVYAIDTTSGTLSEVAGSPFSAGTNPSSVNIDPTYGVVYVVNEGSANVSEFTLESTGALTPLAGSPVPVGTNPTYMAIAW